MSLAMWVQYGCKPLRTKNRCCAKSSPALTRELRTERCAESICSISRGKGCGGSVVSAWSAFSSLVNPHGRDHFIRPPMGARRRLAQADTLDLYCREQAVVGWLSLTRAIPFYPALGLAGSVYSAEHRYCRRYFYCVSGALAVATSALFVHRYRTAMGVPVGQHRGSLER